MKLIQFIRPSKDGNYETLLYRNPCSMGDPLTGNDRPKFPLGAAGFEEFYRFIKIREGDLVGVFDVTVDSVTLVDARPIPYELIAGLERVEAERRKQLEEENARHLGRCQLIDEVAYPKWRTEYELYWDSLLGDISDD